MTLTVAIVLILGLLWVAVLAPPILRARDRQGRTDSVHDFRYRLTTLGQTNGTHRERPERLSLVHPIFTPGNVGPARVSATQRRRRTVLFAIAGACALTFLLVVATASMLFVVVHLLCDAALAGYVYLLVQYKQRAQQRPPARTAYRRPAAIFAPGFVDRNRDTPPRLVALQRVASR